MKIRLTSINVEVINKYQIDKDNKHLLEVQPVRK